MDRQQAFWLSKSRYDLAQHNAGLPLSPLHEALQIGWALGGRPGSQEPGRSVDCLALPKYVLTRTRGGQATETSRNVACWSVSVSGRRHSDGVLETPVEFVLRTGWPVVGRSRCPLCPQCASELVQALCAVILTLVFFCVASASPLPRALAVGRECAAPQG